MQLCELRALAAKRSTAVHLARCTTQTAIRTYQRIFRARSETGGYRARAGAALASRLDSPRPSELPSLQQSVQHSESPWAKTLNPEDFQKEVESNASGLQLTFLGTASNHSYPRHKLCVALRARRSCLLFECCEDTQRALLKAPHIRPSRIDRIFISCLDGDQMFGLPGMLCSVSAGREEGHSMSDLPVHVYGPTGLAAFLNAALRASDTYLLMPVIVHEYSLTPPDLEGLSDTEVADWQPEYDMINRRARLFQCQLPPDQLHPVGHYDGSPQPLNTRKQLGGGRLPGGDDRSGALPLPLPPPGNPTNTVRLKDASWTMRYDGEYSVTATAVPRDGAPCLAFTYLEADRTGTLDPKEAMRLGALPGQGFAHLKAGKDLELRDGTIVRSIDVLGPRRYGRAVVLMAQTTSPIPPRIALSLAAAPLLIAPAFHQGSCVAAAMGSLANQLASRQVFVTCCGEELPNGADKIACSAAVEERVQRSVVDLSRHTSARVFSAEQYGVINVDRFVKAAQ